MAISLSRAKPIPPFTEARSSLVMEELRKAHQAEHGAAIDATALLTTDDSDGHPPSSNRHNQPRRGGNSGSRGNHGGSHNGGRGNHGGKKGGRGKNRGNGFHMSLLTCNNSGQYLLHHIPCDPNFVGLVLWDQCPHMPILLKAHLPTLQLT